MKKRFYNVTFVCSDTNVRTTVESELPIEVFGKIISALVKGDTVVTIEEAVVISDTQLFRAMAKAL